MRAINLKTNHISAPIGMDAGPLFLSWQCTDGTQQTAYEITASANVLKSTDQTVQDIAASLSFGTRNYFSRIFQEVTGQTPMEYRES